MRWGRLCGLPIRITTTGCNHHRRPVTIYPDRLHEPEQRRLR